jgi:uncharacterized membrane protein
MLGLGLGNAWGRPVALAAVAVSTVAVAVWWDDAWRGAVLRRGRRRRHRRTEAHRLDPVTGGRSPWAAILRAASGGGTALARYDILKTIHILAAMVWVGGVIVMRVIGTRMGAAEPAHRLGFARDQRALIRTVFTPAAAVVLTTGVWMVADAPVIGFGQAWIVIGLFAVVAPMGAAHAYTLPRSSRAVSLMEQGRGPEAAAIVARFTPVILAVIAVLVVAVWAMVAKPGL